MNIGVALRVRYEVMPDVVAVAEQLGYESVWVPDHLVFPADIHRHAPREDMAHAPIDPTIPTFDNLVLLSRLSAATRRLRFGTWVYNLALRHPFVAARAALTLDHLTGGRFILGVGAGWIPGEYAATGVPFATRGARLEETVAILRTLWRDELPSHDGTFYRFDAVRFEPKPIAGTIPIHIGGDSAVALARAARIGDGWIGSWHTAEVLAGHVATLRGHLREHDRSATGFEVTVAATPRTPEEMAAYAEAGATRILVSPWERSRDAVAGLEDYAQRLAEWGVALNRPSTTEV